MSHSRTAIWAVDAFSEKAQQTKNLNTMQLISEALHLEIDPVYVLTSSEVHIQNDLYPTWAMNYEKASSTFLEALVKSVHFLKMRKATVLTSHIDSLRGSIDQLLKYAKSKHTRLIFVNSHAKEGLSRFFLGSFTETLLLQSKIPVLVTNPTTETRSSIKNIMFPTNFFNDTRQGLEDAVLLSKRLGAELTLYHKEVTPLYLAFPEAPFYNIYIEDIAKKLKKNADEWVEWAKKQGVACKVYIDNSTDSGVIGKHITQYAENHKIDLICLITQSSSLEAAILGSTARYVARHAHCPVWVHHA
jgi:nucleotide-binding universal stress UspA family protein